MLYTHLINQSYPTKKDLRNLIYYVLGEHCTTNIYGATGMLLSNPETMYQSMIQVKKQFNKTEGRQALHIIISFDKEEYFVGDSINIKWIQATANTDFYQYWLVIKDPNGQLVNNSATGDAGEIDKNQFNFIASVEGKYEISVWSVPYNNKAERQRFESATINIKNRNENTTTEPNEDLTKNCSCNCHSSGFMNLIFRIILFIQKIFNMNSVCTCGIAHY